MIETTLEQLVTAAPVLRRLAEIRLSGKASYDLAKLVEAVLKETTIFETEQRKLLKEFGTERDATDEERVQFGERVVTVGQDKVVAYQACLTEMLVVKVTLERSPLKFESLGDTELSASDWLALGPLITTPPE